MRDFTTHPDQFEPVRNGLNLKPSKPNNRSYGPSGASIFKEGSNEFKIKRMGPSHENRGPSGRKSRAFAVLRRAIGSRIPRYVSRSGN